MMMLKRRFWFCCDRRVYDDLDYPTSGMSEQEIVDVLDFMLETSRPASTSLPIGL